VVAFSSVLAAAFLGTILAVRFSAANAFTLFASISLLAVTFSVVGIAESSVRAVALLLAFFAEIVGWAAWNEETLRGGRKKNG
jgi:hypothetical protein